MIGKARRRRLALAGLLAKGRKNAFRRPGQPDQLVTVDGVAVDKIGLQGFRLEGQRRRLPDKTALDLGEATSVS